MTLINRYIGIAVLGAIGVVLCVLISISTLFNLIEYLYRSDTSEGGLLQVLLGIPKNIYDMVPYAVLIGGFLGLGKLASQNELVVLRALGMTPYAMARLLFLLGVGLSVLLVLLDVWLVAPAEQYANRLHNASTATQDVNAGALNITGRILIKNEQNYLYLQQRAPHGLSLSYYQYDPAGLRQLIKAETLQQQSNGDWLLEDVVVTQFNDEKVITEHHNRMQIPSPLHQGSLQRFFLQPQLLSIVELYRHGRYLGDSGNSQRYRQIFWSRIAGICHLPFLLLFTMIVFLKTARFSSIGMYLVIGIVSGIVFFSAQTIVFSLGIVWGLPDAIGAILPSVFLGGGLSYYIYRMS